MEKVIIHIENESTFNDDDVCIHTELHSVPRVGEIVYIGCERKRILENMAKKSVGIASRYAPKWFFGKSFSCDHVNENNLNDLCFDDVMYVKSVAYYAVDGSVHIELGDE